MEEGASKGGREGRRDGKRDGERKEGKEEGRERGNEGRSVLPQILYVQVRIIYYMNNHMHRAPPRHKKEKEKLKEKHINK